MIDFGGWASEAYRVPTVETPDSHNLSTLPDDSPPDRR